MPADPILNQPEGVLHFFRWDSHSHVDSIELEAQPGYSLCWRGSLVGCLLKAEALKEDLQQVEVKRGCVVIASYASEIVDVTLGLQRLPTANLQGPEGAPCMPCIFDESDEVCRCWQYHLLALCYVPICRGMPIYTDAGGGGIDNYPSLVW